MQALRFSFNPAAQRVFADATKHAAQRHAAFVEPEHLLLALASTGCTASRALTSNNADPQGLQTELLLLLPAPTGIASSAPREGPAIERIRHYAWKEAAHLGHRQIDPLHLLLGLLYEDTGAALDLLRRRNLSIYDLRTYVMEQPLAEPLRPAAWTHIRPSPLFLLLVGLAAGSGAWLFLGPPERLVQALTVVFVLAGYVVCLCLHEFGHALAAYIGGDDSVVNKGYLTLDPRRYTHPFLSIVLPLVFLLIGGFGLPGGAVYINQAALRNRRWSSLVSAAGPLATLLCLALLAWPFAFDWYDWITDQNQYLWPALALLAFLQVTALVFNLLPIPSLDGFGIIAPWIDPDPRVYQFGQILLFLMFYMLWQDSPLSSAFWGNMYAIAELLKVPGDMVSYGWDQFFGRG